MRRATFILATSVAACGGLLPFTGDDEQPPAPPPAIASADAADDADSADGSSNVDASIGEDSGLACVPSKKCAEGPDECCSGQATGGCIPKCEITCCL